jgi:hypothetical protein
METTNTVLDILAEAYPDGVPDADAAALLAVLRQRLGSERTLQVALTLVAQGLLSAEHAAKGSAPKSPLPAVDLRRVSAQLVMAGWPLGEAPSEEDDDDIDEPGSYLGRIMSWLRDGYPQGVPDHDYQPLLALLERRLTRSEVKQVARALRRASIAPVGPDDIAAVIEDVTHTEATPTDLERVRDRLTKKGWPVDFPDPL